MSGKEVGKGPLTGGAAPTPTGAPRPIGKSTRVAELEAQTVSGRSVRHAASSPSSTGGQSSKENVVPPVAGIDQTGFIDRKDGANLHTDPLGADSMVLAAPLPAATRVFVSGTHPRGADWWYVTAFLPGTAARGYVQRFRVNTRLPEPLAELHKIEQSDTAEGYARAKFSSAVTDGHDLRYYENVLLYVNRERHPVGIHGTYQDPGVLGGGSNNIQLNAGELIWLVSAEYAKSLQSMVPSGSLTGGAVAKARRFVSHIEDIVHSVTESRQHFGEVAGEYAHAIREHLPEIVGIVAAFIMAEATSAFLAATPTGVTQIAAVVIQLALSAFGAASMVQAGAAAIGHATSWLTLAWTAHGKKDQITASSIEFIRMLVAIATAALSYLGAKTNYGNALKIANSMPTAGLAVASGTAGSLGQTGAGAGVLLGPGTGSFGAAGNAMMQADGNGGGSGKSDAAKSPDPAKELEEIKQKLEQKDLSGKQKQALRARKKELQEQLGTSSSEPIPEEPATPTRYKVRASGLSGKEAATDVPSWIKNWPDARPGIDESGTAFATRMMNKRYGAGRWSMKGEQNTEFSKLRKFADRAFE